VSNIFNNENETMNRLKTKKQQTELED